MQTVYVYQPRRHWKPLGPWDEVDFFSPSVMKRCIFFCVFYFDLQLPCFHYVTEFLIFTVMHAIKNNKRHVKTEVVTFNNRELKHTRF